MAQVTVKNNTKAYTVENALDTMECISQDLGNGELRKITLLEIGMSVDSSQQTKSRGVARGVFTISLSGTDFGSNEENIGLSAPFDETKANIAGIGNYLKRILINELFDHYFQIKPLTVSSGAVKTAYK